MSNFPSIQATVLQRNNQAFVCNPCGGYGTNMAIPCGTAALIGVQEWATPQRDQGFFQGFRYQISSTQPTYDSIPCYKVTNTINSDYYMVIGTVDEYNNGCAACCSTSPAPTLVKTLADIALCHAPCTTDGTNYTTVWTVKPAALLGSGRYVSRVEKGGGLVYQATFANGQTSIANLIITLNTFAGTAQGVGVWTNPGGETIKLTANSNAQICFIACVKTS